MKLKTALKKVNKDYPVIIIVGNLLVYKGTAQLDVAKYDVNEYLNNRVLVYDCDTKYNFIHCKGDLYLIDK